MQATVAHIRAVPRPPGELERLFREHHAQIFRTAYRVTGSATDAEDVLQTVFLRLARRQQDDAQQDFSPNPMSYFHRAAVNASLDLLRGRSRAKSVSLEDVSSDLVSSAQLSPEAQHEERELRKLLRQAVARLGEHAAEVFALRYFEGYDNREIAEMLKTSQMVVAVTLHRARTRLRREIGEFLEKSYEA